MLRKAIPEGVIAPGGHVAGFLYFAKVAPDTPEANFTAKLVDAHRNAVRHGGHPAAGKEILGDACNRGNRAVSVYFGGPADPRRTLPGALVW